MLRLETCLGKIIFSKNKKNNNFTFNALKYICPEFGVSGPKTIQDRISPQSFRRIMQW